MSDVVVDRVQIEIEAHAAKAGGSIDDLIGKIQKLQKALQEKIDTEKLRQSVKSIENLQSKFKNVKMPSFAAAETSCKNLGECFRGLLEDVKNFHMRMGSMAPTAQYTELEEKIQRAEDALQKLLDKQDRMEAQGINQNSAGWKGLQYDIRVATDRVADYRRDLELLQASGGASEHVNRFSVAFRNMTATVKKTVDVVQRAGNALKFFLGKIRNMGGGLRSANGGMKRLNASAVPLAKSLMRVGNILKLMLTRLAIKAVLNSIGEGFRNLARQSGEFNAKVSNLMGSCKQLAGSMASLASPLLDIFGPALTKIINLLSTATAYINQFLSALSGKSFFTSAKKQNVDYAASLDSVGKAAEEVKDATTGIDELNIISQKDDKNGGGADALEDYYEQLAVNQKILDSVQNLKKLFAELFQPMKQAWEDYGQGVIDGFQYAVSSCKKLVVDMAKTWKEVWLNGSGYETCKNILLLLENMLKWIGDIATAWDLAWQVKGTAYVQSVFDKLNAVLSLIYTISESFRNAFNSGSGQEAIEHIYQIITDLNNTIANLANRFREAWEAAGIGDAIAQSIFDIINLILGSVEKISGSTEKWAKSLDLGPLLKSINNLLEKTKPLVEKIGDALSWVWENVILPLGKWAIETALPEVIDGVAVAFEALDAVLEALEPTFKWIWNHMLVPLANWTGGTIVDIIDGITKAFKGIHKVFKMISDGEDWGTVGKYLWEGLLKGISNVGEWVWKKLGEVFGGIVDFVKDLFGIHSPSTVFEGIGKNTIDGFIEGIKNFKDNCTEPVTKWSEGVADWFTGGDGEGNIFEKFKTFGRDVVSGFRDSIGSVYTTSQNNMTTWGAKIQEWYTNSNFGGINKETFAAFVTNVIDSFKTRIGGYYSAVQSNMVAWASKIRSWFTDNGGVNKSNFSLFATNIIDSFKSRVGGYYTTSGSNMTTWGSYIKNTFQNAGVSSSSFYNIASDVVNGFKNGIGALYSSCKDTIEAWGSGIVSWFKEKLKVASPSRVFKEIGQFTVAGFNAGIDNSGGSTAAHITEWVERFADFTAEIKPRFSIDDSALKKYTPNYGNDFTADTVIRKNIMETIQATGTVRAEVDTRNGFREILADVVQPYLDKIAANTGTTAENTKGGFKATVEIDGREIVRATSRARSAGGFSFTPAPA